jgi:hypothetical protein
LLVSTQQGQKPYLTDQIIEYLIPNAVAHTLMHREARMSGRALNESRGEWNSSAEQWE